MDHLKPPRFLIIGGDSFLGTGLFRLLTQAGFHCARTTRSQAGSESGLFLDLTQPIEIFAEGLANQQFTHALICAAVSDIDQCFINPTESHAVNVSGTIGLIQFLVRNRIQPVFFSSEYVFNASKNSYRESDPTCPVTLYGRQKKEVEETLPMLTADFLVFRISKLMSLENHPRNILTPVVRSLNTGTPYKAFTDQWVTPVFIEDIARLIPLATSKDLKGVFHLGTEKILSRYEMAVGIASLMKRNASPILPVPMSEARFVEKRGHFNTLDSGKIRAALDFRFMETLEGLSQIADQLKDW